jgi:hypothetical protein
MAGDRGRDGVVAVMVEAVVAGPRRVASDAGCRWLVVLAANEPADPAGVFILLGGRAERRGGRARPSPLAPAARGNLPVSRPAPCLHCTNKLWFGPLERLRWARAAANQSALTGGRRSTQNGDWCLHTRMHTLASTYKLAGRAH